MKVMKCVDCGEENGVNPALLSARRELGFAPACTKCGGAVRPIKRTGKSDNQKRSISQEKYAAKKYGGKVQPASGAGDSKGDVRVRGKMRVECKLTRAKSFSLKLAQLQKIASEASSGEHPVFEIEFQGVHPHERYVVLPGWLFDYYRGLDK